MFYKTLFLPAVACAVLAVEAAAFPPNPLLAGMADDSFRELQTGGNCGSAFIDGKILSYNGSVYDRFRHKIITFGGGHATSVFPNGVAEFDFNGLSWNYIIPNFDCRTVYSQQNALLTGSGAKLGGFRLNGKIYAGSRHTYDGLVMAADTCLMLCMQAQEFEGCDGWDVGAYVSYYKGGSGLFMLDPVAKAWSVSASAGLAAGYSMAAVNPNEPDWVYGGTSGYSGEGFYKVNWRTGQKVTLRYLGADTDHSLSYYPGRNSFFFFVDSMIYEYGISSNTWKTLKTAGPAPVCYSLEVAWDTLNRVFATFYDNKFYYYSPVENRWYTTAASFTMARLFHNHIYDPVDNVHIMVGNSGVFETYAYKFSDTPGTFPGTGLAEPSAVTLSFVRKALPDLLHASPNPAHGGVVAFETDRRLGRTPAISLFDVSGRKIAESRNAGGLAWNTAAVPAGLYLAVARGNGMTAERIVIVTK